MAPPPRALAAAAVSPSRSHRACGVALVLVAACAAIVVGAGPPRAGASPPAAREASPNPRSEPFRPADFSGRLTVVHFWATWCPPCTDELPSLAAFYRGPYRRLARRGLVLVSVNNDVRRRDLREYIDATPLPFPVYVDSLGALNDRYDLIGLPGTLLLGPGGEVLDRLLGPQDWQSAALLRRLEGHLGD